MNPIQSDDYEDMAATYQVMLIHWLNDAFKDAKVTDKEMIRKVVNNFFMSMGTFTDQYWFADTEGNRVYPCICFSKAGPAADTELDQHKDVHFPSKFFSWQEYAMSNVDHYFDEMHEDVKEIPHSLEAPE